MTRGESTYLPPMFRPFISGAAGAVAGRVPGAVRRPRRAPVWGAVLLLAVLVGSAAGAGAIPVAAATGAPGHSIPAATSSDITASPNFSNPPCLSLNQTLCISVENSSVPDIVPGPGSHGSTVEPSSNTTISLYLKSMHPLVWPTAKGSGPLSPMTLNATGKLWNGDPYYSQSDGTMWHPSGPVWWTFGPTGTNTTYPYWYGLNFSAKSSTGLANFFPGMTLTWWVYIVSNSSGLYSHWLSLNYTFTFAGAWPYSPYPGGPNPTGASAAAEDISVLQNPLEPNFNDSVNVTVATTSADTLPGATIGGANLNFTEYAPDGALLDQTTFSFPVTVSGSVGAISTQIQIPSALAHEPGALVEYTITAWDTNTYGPDQIVTGVYNYTVNGNGTFADDIFQDDLALTTTPVGPGLGGFPPPQIAAGAPVQLLLSSKNTGTAIFAAEAYYTFNYSAIGETATGTIPFDRLNSTNFHASLPPMPLGSSVSFQVLAWDFAQTRDVSSTLTYVTPTLASLVPTIPTNSTFFVVYVYDNGTHRWVSGASVQIQSASGYVHSDATSFDGVAYPNATGQPFAPLLLPAGESYRISVEDPSFLPSTGSAPSAMVITLAAPHDLTTRGVLYVGSDFIVAQAGNAVYFWLNQSTPSTSYSAPVGLDSAPLIGAGVGLAALALAVVPLMVWWSRIRARRLAQEKRITL
jgi:hypothetical protein